MAAYLAMWGTLHARYVRGNLKANRALQLVFGTLAILFFLLALGDATGNGTITGDCGIRRDSSADFWQSMPALHRS